MLIRKRLSRVGLGGAGERHGAPRVSLAARECVRVRARLPDPAVVAADAALVADVVVAHDPLVVVAVVNVAVAVDITWSWGVVHHSILVVHHHSETNIYHPILSCNTEHGTCLGLVAVSLLPVCAISLCTVSAQWMLHTRLVDRGDEGGGFFLKILKNFMFINLKQINVLNNESEIMSALCCMNA